jgi:hypothetical protein
MSGIAADPGTGQMTQAVIAARSKARVQHLAIDGPDDLDRIDALSIRIRDDIRHRTELSRSIGTQVTPEQIRGQIWGPLRFHHGTDGGSADGRSVEPFPLEVGESRPLLMRPTVKPGWTDVPWGSASTTASRCASP